MLNSKEIILNNIDCVFTEFNKIKEEKNDEFLKLINENSELRNCNKKLLLEVSEKEKQLIINEKKMVDYENMINQIQENAMKEKTEKERFDMLKKQDKEIHERDIEIKRLQKKVNILEDKLTLLAKKSDVDDDIIEIRETNTDNETLVEKMKKIKVKQDLSDEGVSDPILVDVEGKSEENEIATPVVNNPDDKGEVEIIEKPDVDKIEDEIEIETPVIDNPNDKEEGDESGEETEELSDDEEGEEVEIITHYKKEYYIIVNENPQYIYSIVDGDLGDKVGEIKEGKKILYKSSKK